MTAERSSRLTIGRKLMLMFALLLTGVIGLLATYWTSQQIGSMTAELRRKAGTYGALVANQTTSAVAFSDRATAAEVLGSLEIDPDVVAIVLLGSTDEPLYTRGTPSPWVARVGQIDARVVHTVGRISAITPVKSLEGPRGTLVIQLSTAGLDAARSRVRTLAIATGLVALALGIVIAWWIARRLGSRLRALASAAKAVAAGDLDRPALVDRSSDEIGMVVGSFNEMVSQLRHLIARLRHVSKRDRERLEALVTARTAQLDRRNAEMRLIFDHVDQGFLTLDASGAIASEHSAAVERWLGPVPATGTFADYVRTFAPDAADWFDMSWSSITEGALPVEICLAQLPSRFEVGGRRLSMSYQPLVDESGSLRVLVVISDETAIAQRERAERDERETTALVSRLLEDRRGFAAFIAEAQHHVDTITAGQRGTTFLRSIHTLKGVCAIEGVSSIAELCHELESSIVEGDEPGIGLRCAGILARWSSLSAKVAPFVEAATGQVTVSHDDLQGLENAIAAGASNQHLATLVATWRFDRVAARLGRFADQAHVLAGQLCKDPVEVRVEVDPDLRMPLDRFTPFWTAFVHALRNAMDHGIETQSERLLAGKAPTALLVVRAHQRHGEIMVELEDSGRGIDWDRIAACARATGLPSATLADLQRALFSDGISTRTEVTELSGRGVGLAALHDACTSSGGRLAVSSTRGVGTKVTATWPVSPAPALLHLAV